MPKAKSRLIVSTRPPRNPYVAAAYKRLAGPHTTSHKAERQRAKAELRTIKIPVKDGDFFSHAHLISKTKGI